MHAATSVAKVFNPGTLVSLSVAVACVVSNGDCVFSQIEVERVSPSVIVASVRLLVELLWNCLEQKQLIQPLLQRSSHVCCTVFLYVG